MTSKNLFFKLLKEDLKQRLWSVILAAIVFFIIPVSMALQVENMKGLSPLDTYLYCITRIVTNSEWLVIITCVGAVLCGLSGFWYLFSKKKVDFFHALPLKREVLFAVRYINGILIYAVPYIVALVVSLVIAGVGGMFPEGIIGQSISWFFFHLCNYLVLYTVTIIAVLLTGNLVIAMAATGILNLYTLAVYALLMGYGSTFFGTFASTGIFEGSTSFLKWTSPLYLYIQYFNQEKLSICFSLFLLTAVLVAIAVWLYKKRAMECAGSALAFEKTKMPIRILLAIPCGLAMGIFLYLVSYSSSTIWLIFGIFCGVVLAHGLLESIYQYDIRKALAHKWQLLGTLLVTLLIAFSYQQDWFGFDTYLPKEEKLESIGIRVQAFQTSTGYWYSEDEVYWSEKGNATELATLYDIAEFGVQATQAPSGYYVVNSSTYYVQGERTVTRPVNITYKLKNGKEVKRVYHIDLFENEALWEALYANTDYAETLFAYELSLKAENLEVVQTGKELMYKTYSLSLEEKEELLSCLAKDLRAFQYHTLCEEFPVVELDLSIKDYRTIELSVYPSYTNTLAFLKSHGFNSEETIPLENVSQIVLSDYRNEKYWEDIEYVEYSYTTEEGVVITEESKENLIYDVIITDEAEIRRLYPYLVWNGYHTSIFTPIMDDINCFITIDTDKYGNYEKIYYNLKEGTPVDSFIEKAMKQEQE